MLSRGRSHRRRAARKVSAVLRFRLDWPARSIAYAVVGGCSRWSTNTVSSPASTTSGHRLPCPSSLIQNHSAPENPRIVMGDLNVRGEDPRLHGPRDCWTLAGNPPASGAGSSLTPVAAAPGYLAKTPRTLGRQRPRRYGSEWRPKIHDRSSQRQNASPTALADFAN